MKRILAAFPVTAVSSWVELTVDITGVKFFGLVVPDPPTPAGVHAVNESFVFGSLTLE